MLKSDHLYFLNTSNIIYLWVGSKLDKETKLSSFAVVQEHMKEMNKEESCSIERIVENAETAMFINNFYVWNNNRMLLPSQMTPFSVGKVTKPLKQEEIDLTSFERIYNGLPSMKPDSSSLSNNVYKMNGGKYEEVER